MRKEQIKKIRITLWISNYMSNNQKKGLTSMSEVNVRKWHKLIISSHFISKIGHAKIKLGTSLVPGHFYTVCSGRSPLFCIFIRCESCKWRPLQLHVGFERKH